MKKLKEIFSLFKHAFQDFSRNDPLIMGSSTAFFSLFSIPAILFVLLLLMGFFLDEEFLRHELFSPMEQTFGPDAAAQVITIIEAFMKIGDEGKYIIGGTVFFFIVSTTLFIVLRNNINRIWKIKPRKGAAGKGMIIKRLASVLIIFLGGILVLVTVVAESVIAFVADVLPELNPEINVALVQIANRLVALLMVAVWFTLLFKLMPDAKIKWKTAVAGGVFTAVLFSAGKIIIGFIFIGNLDDVYGAGSAVFLLLLFIFYVSEILYFGASFTKAFAEKTGDNWQPEKWAEKYEIKSAEDNE
jgi:membrane protein